MKSYKKLNLKYACMSIMTLLICSFFGCKKMVEIAPPVTSITGEEVYKHNASAIAVMTGLYSKLSNSQFYSNEITSSSATIGLSSDEFTLWDGASDPAMIAQYQNNLSTSSDFDAGTGNWVTLYANIYICNSALANLDNNTALTPAVAKQLAGEAKFMRAYFYFYLVNLYGEVPLALTPDYTVNSTLVRSAKATVYSQIIADLKDAKGLLNENFVDVTLISPSVARVRPTKWAASALLARTYLYTNDWINAESESALLINNSTQFDLQNVPLKSTFVANSKEAIWQLQPVGIGITNTFDAMTFILIGNGLNDGNPVSLSTSLISSFEAGDQRMKNWVGNVIFNGSTLYFPFKYKINAPNAPVAEYLTIFRLAEQFLIRAEARIQQNKVAEGIADLNVIRRRASDLAAPTVDQLKQLSSTLSQTDALTALAHERRVELFSEQGHRWLDLKRTGKIDEIMTVETLKKGGVWRTSQQLYPIPISDIQRDQNLVQNPGY